LAAQKNRRVGAASPNVYAYAGEGIAGSLPYEKCVAYARTFGVRSGEEARACARGVEECDLRCRDEGDGVGAGFGDGRFLGMDTQFCRVFF
jgi:hypothetical protein